jgi:hypothetical protein
MTQEQSSGTQRDCRQAFGETVAAWKRRRLYLEFGMIPALLCLLAGVVWREARAVAGVIFLIVMVPLFIVGMASRRLECPACHGNTRSRLGPCCPNCGASESVRYPKPKSFRLMSVESPKCERCDAAVGRGNRGALLYSIKFCTHCGAHVSDKGV